MQIKFVLCDKTIFFSGIANHYVITLGITYPQRRGALPWPNVRQLPTFRINSAFSALSARDIHFHFQLTKKNRTFATPTKHTYNF